MYNQINFEFLTLHHEGGGQIPPPLWLWSLIALTGRFWLVPSSSQLGHMSTFDDPDPIKFKGTLCSSSPK